MKNNNNSRAFGQERGDLAWLFLLFAITGVLLFAFLTPPFQVPDENMHFFHAEELSRGQLTSERRYLAEKSRIVTGGDVDSNALIVASRFLPLKEDPDSRLSSNELSDASRMKWGGQSTFMENSASFYPPHLYLPGALAIVAGKSLGLGIVDTYLLVRVTNGTLATLLAFLALRLTTLGGPLLFFVLLMPMSLFQMVSASQDSLLIGISALTVALLSRVWVGPVKPATAPRLEVFCLTVLMVAAATAKPTHSPLLLLLLAPLKGTQSLTRLRLTCFACGIVFVVAWQLWSMKYLSSSTVVYWRPHLDPSKQLADLLAHPNGFLRAAWHTVTWKAVELPGYVEYWKEFVGALTWLWARGSPGAFFPNYFYGIAAGYMFIAIMVCGMSELRITNVQRLLVAVAIGGGVILTFLSMYILFTDFRAYTIRGVQGRYFIPLSMLLGLLVAGLIHSTDLRRPSCRILPDVKKWLWCVLLTWPAIALPFSVRNLVLRYYLT